MAEGEPSQTNKSLYVTWTTNNMEVSQLARSEQGVIINQAELEEKKSDANNALNKIHAGTHYQGEIVPSL